MLEKDVEELATKYEGMAAHLDAALGESWATGTVGKHRIEARRDLAQNVSRQLRALLGYQKDAPVPPCDQLNSICPIYKRGCQPKLDDVANLYRQCQAIQERKLPVGFMPVVSK